MSHYSNGTSPSLPVGTLVHRTGGYGTNGQQTGDMPSESTALWSRVEDIFRHDQQKRQLIEVILLGCLPACDMIPDWTDCHRNS